MWDWGSWDGEAVAEIVEERDFELLAGLGEAKHDVAGVAAFVADSPSGDFALGDEDADVVFRGVRVERDMGMVEDAQEIVLKAKEAPEQAVESGVAGSGAVEDAVELRPQAFGFLGARGELVFFQGAIEPPDHAPGDLDRVALLVVGGDELVDEAFGVHPAQSVFADAELAGAVGHDDGLAEQALLANGAP